MKLGVVQGKVWATVKDPKLHGIKFYIMQPIDEFEQPMGKPMIAADSIGTREGDVVYWVSGAEATFLLDERQIPSDVSIVGLVDRLDT